MYIMNYNKDNLLKKMDNIDYNNLNSSNDKISLEGTNINDLSKINYNFKKSQPINKNILKSITREIISNLQENSLDENESNILDNTIGDDTKDENIEDDNSSLSYSLDENIKKKKE